VAALLERCNRVEEALTAQESRRPRGREEAEEEAGAGDLGDQRWREPCSSGARRAAAAATAAAPPRRAGALRQPQRAVGGGVAVDAAAVHSR
jgi:hypothetical protein